MEPPLPEEVGADQLATVDPATPARLTWEYSGAGGWQPLGSLDQTQALSGRGVVEFIGPADLVARTCFGQDLPWLRLRWQQGTFALAPRLRRALLNTTWAAQITTVADEILGSSNGKPGQGFTAAQALRPARGQQVLVRELADVPTPADEQALIAEVEARTPSP